MKIACVVMQRNEDLCLEPWLTYHEHLFGHEHLFVLDHHSDHAGVRETLSRFAARGGHLLSLPATADYRQKGEFVSFAMRQVPAGYDFVLPLDCDEFVAMRRPDGQASCNRDSLARYFATLPAAITAFEVQENFLNMLGHPKTFFALPYRKIFFRGGQCGIVDHGSHELLWPIVPIEKTRLAYVHFHHRSFARYRRAAEEKLRPFLDVSDPAAIERFRGPGWHMVTHLQKTEREFQAIMTPDDRCFDFHELHETFLTLGIDPHFCEH